MRIPPLTYHGTCYTCGKTMALKQSRKFKTIGAMPYHLHKGVRCRGVGYSARDIHPVILTDEQMDAVATFIATDDGRCLEHVSHSLACGDGRNCVKIRRLLATAFAKYYLKQIALKQAA